MLDHLTTPTLSHITFSPHSSWTYLAVSKTLVVFFLSFFLRPLDGPQQAYDGPQKISPSSELMTPCLSTLDSPSDFQDYMSFHTFQHHV